MSVRLSAAITRLQLHTERRSQYLLGFRLLSGGDFEHWDAYSCDLGVFGIAGSQNSAVYQSHPDGRCYHE